MSLYRIVIDSAIIVALITLLGTVLTAVLNHYLKMREEQKKDDV